MICLIGDHIGIGDILLIRHSLVGAVAFLEVVLLDLILIIRIVFLAANKPNSDDDVQNNDEEEIDTEHIEVSLGLLVVDS